MRLLQLGLVGALTALVAAGACDGASDETTACVAGQAQACTGPGQCAGVQLCNADGTALGACTCGSGGSGAAGQGGSGASGGSGATGGSSGTGGSAGAGGVCVDDVKDGIDALSETGQFLPGLDAAHFCSAGQVQFQIVSIPAEELALLQSDPLYYVVLFALSDSANRNYAMINSMRRVDDDPQSDVVVKAGGGSCLDCTCCGCLSNPTQVGCTNEVGRPQCPALVVGDHYTLRWSAPEHTMCIHRESDPEECFDEVVPNVFAFNRYCAAPGCAMMHWTAGHWTAGSVVLTDHQYDQIDTVAPASCP
jgi:hypothetical protein